MKFYTLFLLVGFFSTFVIGMPGFHPILSLLKSFASVGEKAIHVGSNMASGVMHGLQTTLHDFQKAFDVSCIDNSHSLDEVVDTMNSAVAIAPVAKKLVEAIQQETQSEIKSAPKSDQDLTAIQSTVSTAQSTVSTARQEPSKTNSVSNDAPSISEQSKTSAELPTSSDDDT